MANEKMIWKGGSGKPYEFTIITIDKTFQPKYCGNYIFAKIVGNAWHAVYMGEGDLKDRTETHKTDGCVIKKGATHIHYRLNSDSKSSFADETDLLAGNQEAYEPNGCNVKKGG